MFAYDESNLRRIAERRSPDNLSATIPYEELLNHISTIFYTPIIEIEVGKENPRIQRWMRRLGWRSLIGMTPQFPISDPFGLNNAQHIRGFEEKAKIPYIPALGRARDFPLGGGGCFVLLDVSPSEAIALLLEDGKPTQLSFTCLPQTGKAQLVSCIEP